MSNSNLPVQFIKILKKQIPADIFDSVINNLPSEIKKNPLLAKSIRKIEETFNNKNIEKFTDNNPPDKVPVAIPITNADIAKLPPAKPKSKGPSFSSIYTPTGEFDKPVTVPFDGKLPGPREPEITASGALSTQEKLGDSSVGVSTDYFLGKPEVKPTVPKTDSLNRSNQPPEKPKKKSENDKEVELAKKEADIKKREEELLKKEIAQRIKDEKLQKLKEMRAEKVKKANIIQKKIKNKKAKQIFNGKSLPAEVPKPDALPNLDSLDVNKKLKDTHQNDLLESISSILEKPLSALNTLSVGKVLQNISGVTGLFPNSIYSLSIQQLVNYSLKAFGDLFIDISQNITNLSMSKIVELLLKENRILYIGIWLFIISTIMYIFNNFIRLPFSFAGLFGFGDKKVVVNNF